MAAHLKYEVCSIVVRERVNLCLETATDSEQLIADFMKRLERFELDCVFPFKVPYANGLKSTQCPLVMLHLECSRWVLCCRVCCKLMR